MPETLRLLEAADQHQHARLMAHAFGKGRVVAPPAEDAAPAASLATTWGLFEDSRLLASCIVNPYQICWPDPGPDPGDRLLSMGGIGGVATWADQRGRGHVDRLLRHCLGVMRDQGQVVSALYPFSFAFYARLGWDWTGDVRRVVLPLRSLKRAMPQGWRVEPVEGDTAAVRAVLEPLWQRHARRIRGAFPATHHNWESRLAHSGERTTYPYVARDETGAARGYLLWRYADGDQGEVREWVSPDARTDAALCTLLRDLGMQCPKATLETVDELPIKARCLDNEVEVAVRTEFQSRVVDIAGAVAALGRVPVADGTALLRIADPHAPWNDGDWTLAVQEGHATLARGGNADAPDLAASIGAFTQIVYGNPDLATLERAGVVETRPGAGLDLLRRLFPRMPVHSWDGF